MNQMMEDSIKRSIKGVKQAIAMNFDVIYGKIKKEATKSFKSAHFYSNKILINHDFKRKTLFNIEEEKNLEHIRKKHSKVSKKSN